MLTPRLLNLTRIRRSCTLLTLVLRGVRQLSLSINSKHSDVLVHMVNRDKDNSSKDIYRLVEAKLEHIVDNLLSAKNSGDDNILLDIHHTIEKIFITSAMRLKNNNVTQAAKLLGINRNTLSKKLKELDRNGTGRD